MEPHPLPKKIVRPPHEKILIGEAAEIPWRDQFYDGQIFTENNINLQDFNAN